MSESLHEIADRLVQPGRTIVAMDETVERMEELFYPLGVPNTPSRRDNLRAFIIGHDSIAQYASGVILHSDSLKSKTSNRLDLAELALEQQQIIIARYGNELHPLVDCPGETIPQSISTLTRYAKATRSLGAKAVKVRSAFSLFDRGMPSEYAVQANVDYQVKFSSKVQENDMVAMPEIEIIRDGHQTMAESYEAHSRVISPLFEAFVKRGIDLKGLVFKMSMVEPGTRNEADATPEQVANWTHMLINEHIPPEVKIAILSGGKPDIIATKHLNALVKYEKDSLPVVPREDGMDGYMVAPGASARRITAAYSRATIGRPVLMWLQDRRIEGREYLGATMKANSLASQGLWNLDRDDRIAFVPEDDRDIEEIELIDEYAE